MMHTHLRTTPALLIIMACLLAAPVSAAPQPRPLGDLTGSCFLFVDDSAIQDKANVTRAYHAFEKHAGNPLLKADKPWEGGTVYLYGTVLPTEDGQGYRMWYHAYGEGEYRMLYATSPDGLRWEKPSLGLVEYKGSKENNILFHNTKENHNPQVIYTPWEADPARRYKLIYYEYGRTPPTHAISGYWAMFSPDGVHWSDAKATPLLPDPGDVGNFVWDPLAKRYVGWPKKFADVRGYNRRCVGFSATTTFEEWPASELVLTPDAFDDRWVTKESTPGAHTDFYGLCGFAYERMYLGLLWIFRITDAKNDGPVFVELVTSHDGKHWQRQEEPRPPLLALGAEGAWDDGMIYTPNHPLVEGNTIKLYYGGFDATHGSDTAGAAIGLATLRKDGFASLDAGATEGTVITKLLDGARGALHVNFRAENGGWVKVEVLDATGAVMPGYTREACTALTGDSTDAPVKWGDKSELPNAQAPMRLRFILRQASIYAFDVP